MAKYQANTKQSVYNYIEENPEWYAASTKFYKRIMNKEIMMSNDTENISYSDLLNQLQGREESDRIVAGYMSLIFHHWISTGKATIISIDVGEKPSNDRNHNENIEKVRKLPSGFKCDLWFGKELEDGVIKWKTTFKTSINNLYKNFQGIKQSSLEVGYTHIETLFTHVKQRRTFSRWAYNSKCIYIFSLGESEWNKLFGSQMLIN